MGKRAEARQAKAQELKRENTVRDIAAVLSTAIDGKSLRGRKNSIWPPKPSDGPLVSRGDVLTTFEKFLDSNTDAANLVLEKQKEIGGDVDVLGAGIALVEKNPEARNLVMKMMLPETNSGGDGAKEPPPPVPSTTPEIEVPPAVKNEDSGVVTSDEGEQTAEEEEVDEEVVETPVVVVENEDGPPAGNELGNEETETPTPSSGGGAPPKPNDGDVDAAIVKLLSKDAENSSTLDTVTLDKLCNAKPIVWGDVNSAENTRAKEERAKLESSGNTTLGTMLQFTRDTILEKLYTKEYDDEVLNVNSWRKIRYKQALVANAYKRNPFLTPDKFGMWAQPYPEEDKKDEKAEKTDRWELFDYGGLKLWQNVNHMVRYGETYKFNRGTFKAPENQEGWKEQLNDIFTKKFTPLLQAVDMAAREHGYEETTIDVFKKTDDFYTSNINGGNNDTNVLALAVVNAMYKYALYHDETRNIAVLETLRYLRWGPLYSDSFRDMLEAYDEVRLDVLQTSSRASIDFHDIDDLIMHYSTFPVIAAWCVFKSNVSMDDFSGKFVESVCKEDLLPPSLYGLSDENMSRLWDYMTAFYKFKTGDDLGNIESKTKALANGAFTNDFNEATKSLVSRVTSWLGAGGRTYTDIIKERVILEKDIKDKEALEALYYILAYRDKYTPGAQPPPLSDKFLACFREKYTDHLNSSYELQAEKELYDPTINAYNHAIYEAIRLSNEVATSTLPSDDEITALVSDMEARQAGNNHYKQFTEFNGAAPTSGGGGTGGRGVSPPVATVQKPAVLNTGGGTGGAPNPGGNPVGLPPGGLPPGGLPPGGLPPGGLPPGGLPPGGLPPGGLPPGGLPPGGLPPGGLPPGGLPPVLLPVGLGGGRGAPVPVALPTGSTTQHFRDRLRRILNARRGVHADYITSMASDLYDLYAKTTMERQELEAMIGMVTAKLYYFGQRNIVLDDDIQRTFRDVIGDLRARLLALVPVATTAAAGKTRKSMANFGSPVVVFTGPFDQDQEELGVQSMPIVALGVPKNKQPGKNTITERSLKKIYGQLNFVHPVGTDASATATPESLLKAITW